MNEPMMYKYEIRQEDGWWIVHVPDLGLTTQARHLRETDRMARSIISLHLDVEPEEVEVFRSNIIGLPASVAEAVKTANDARGRLAGAQASANDATTRAARELVGVGMPLRDAGYLLGLSHQRIAQLVGDHDAKPQRQNGPQVSRISKDGSTSLSPRAGTKNDPRGSKRSKASAS